MISLRSIPMYGIRKRILRAGYNEELQSYSPDNVTTGKDGDRTVLILTAENRNGRIISGRVNSKGKKGVKYGKIEACIKLPETANGLWRLLDDGKQ